MHLSCIVFVSQAKGLYQQLANQAQSLKGLWVAKLNLKGKAALATEADLAAYDSKKEEVNRQINKQTYKSGDKQTDRQTEI